MSKTSLKSGERLWQGQSIVSKNGKYELIVLKTDAVIRSVADKKHVWSTSTNSKNTTQFCMRTDRNIRLYTKSETGQTCPWAANSHVVIPGIPADFVAMHYLRLNPGLANMFDRPENAKKSRYEILARHYVNYGKKAGRKYSIKGLPANFDESSYLEQNSTLSNMFGRPENEGKTKFEILGNHYAVWGVKSGLKYTPLPMDEYTPRTLNMELSLNDDGVLVGRDINGVFWRSDGKHISTVADYHLRVGRANMLCAGNKITSPNGVFELMLHVDGNLVLWKTVPDRTAIWSTCTRHGADHKYWLYMQSDGNLCLYKDIIAPGQGCIWRTKTVRSRSNDYVLAVQNDGNLVLYEKYVAGRHHGSYWSSKTTRSSGYVTVRVNEAKMSKQRYSAINPKEINANDGKGTLMDIAIERKDVAAIRVLRDMGGKAWTNKGQSVFTEDNTLVKVDRSGETSVVNVVTYDSEKSEEFKQNTATTRDDVSDLSVVIPKEKNVDTQTNKLTGSGIGLVYEAINQGLASLAKSSLKEIGLASKSPGHVIENSFKINGAIGAIAIGLAAGESPTSILIDMVTGAHLGLAVMAGGVSKEYGAYDKCEAANSLISIAIGNAVGVEDFRLPSNCGTLGAIETLADWHTALKQCANNLGPCMHNMFSRNITAKPENRYYGSDSDCRKAFSDCMAACKDLPSDRQADCFKNCVSRYNRCRTQTFSSSSSDSRCRVVCDSDGKNCRTVCEPSGNSTRACYAGGSSGGRSCGGYSGGNSGGGWSSNGCSYQSSGGGDGSWW